MEASPKRRRTDADEGAWPSAGNGDARWEATIAAVKPAIVALRITAVRPFEGESAGTYHGTGFVVDSDHDATNDGKIIVTNSDGASGIWCSVIYLTCASGIAAWIARA